MPRQDLAVQTPSSSGITPAFSTPTADGFMVTNDAQTIVWVKNGNAGTCNVTIQTPSTIDGNAVADKVVAIPAGAERVFTFPLVYNQPDNVTDARKVYLDFSVQTSVSVIALHH